MSRNLAIFIVICFLAIGSILVYSKNGISIPKTAPISQTLSGFNAPKTENAKEATPTITMSDQKVTELKIEDQKDGTGAAVVKGNTVEVNYLGTLLNGQKFDSSYDRNQTFSFTVGNGEVIQGWDEGLIGMKVGGKRKLTIPAEMAYGSQAVGGIPANSPLVFEIELVSIK